jgi:hypothetical protein
LGSEDVTNNNDVEEHDLDRSSGHICDNQGKTIDIASS